jgi:hypothetical protein
MMIRKYYKFIILFLGSAIISFSSACETTPTRQAALPGEPACKAPSMLVGDTWVYRDWSSHYGKDVFHRKVIDVEEDGSFAVQVYAKKADTRKEEPSMAKDISTKVHTKLEVMAQLRQRQELLKPLKYVVCLIIYLFTRKIG